MCINDMECPICKTVNKMTVKRYFASPFAKYTCENCNAKFTLVHPAKWFVGSFIWGILYAALLFIAIVISFNTINIWLIYTIVTIIMVPIYIFFDLNAKSNYKTKIIE